MPAYWEPKDDPNWRPSPIPIAVIGNINLDVRTAPIRASAELFRDGETSVDAIHETIGGGGANVALAAARLGATVHFVGCVGRDELAHRLRAHLERFGIVTRLVQKDQPTGRSLALAWDNQHRHFISYLPSSAMLDASDIDLDQLIGSGCRLLYRADIWFAPAMLEGGNERLLRLARAAGMETSLDLNWDPTWNSGDAQKIAPRIESVRKTLRHVCFVHANERELGQFVAGPRGVPSASGTAAAAILGDGGESLILHRGRHGSQAFTRDGQHLSAEAPSIRQSVNATGTGDVFAAAFMLRPDLPLPQRLAAANAVAARHLEGATDLLPRL